MQFPFETQEMEDPADPVVSSFQRRVEERKPKQDEADIGGRLYSVPVETPASLTNEVEEQEVGDLAAPSRTAECPSLVSRAFYQEGRDTYVRE